MRKFNRILAMFIAAIFILSCVPVLATDVESSENAGDAEFVVTDVRTSQTTVQWNEWLDVTVEYQAASEPNEIMLEFDTPASPIPYYTRRLNEDFLINSDSFIPNNSILKSNYFDPVTGKGSISYSRKLNISDYAGSYKLISMEGYYNGVKKSFNIPDELQGFNVDTPYGTPVFDKDYFCEDLISSLESLQDGDVAVVRCDVSLTDISYDEESTGALTRWHLLKKEYLDAIRGKNVTIILPAVGSIVVINGKDITGDTKDLDFGGGMSTFIDFTVADTGKFIFYFTCPGYCELPCRFRYMYDYNQMLDFYLSEKRENGLKYGKKDFDNHIDNTVIYRNNDGSLIPEEKGFGRDDLWLWYDLDRYALFVGSEDDPENLCSFKAVLKSSKLTYTGKAQTPTLRIDPDLELPYTVEYSNKSSKSIGTYTVTVTGTNGGFGTKTLEYQIVPKGTSISSVSSAKKGFTVKWKKQASMTSGYEIQYATNSKFTNGKIVTAKSNKTLSKKITGLKRGKKYYIRVRTYKTKNGVKYYSNWSKKKTFKVK